MIDKTQISNKVLDLNQKSTEISLDGDGLILTFIPYQVNNARQLHDNDLQYLGH